VVAALQAQLSKEGKYTVSDELKAKIKELFYAGCCDDNATLDTIRDTFNEYGYLCDTHTAVAVTVYNQHEKETGDKRPVLIASTASPYKFAKSVLSAVSDKSADDEFSFVKLLSSITNTAVPAPIAALEDATVRFNDVCDKTQMRETVLECLNIK